MSYRRSSARTQHIPRVPLWRVMVVTIGMFWLLAVVLFVVTQWIAPAFYNAVPPSPTSGFNYGQAFGLPFIKTWGLWISGALVILGLFAAAWRALERGGEAVMGKALGTTGNRRGRRRR